MDFKFALTGEKTNTFSEDNTSENNISEDNNDITNVDVVIDDIKNNSTGVTEEINVIKSNINSTETKSEDDGFTVVTKKQKSNTTYEGSKGNTFNTRGGRSNGRGGRSNGRGGRSNGRGGRSSGRGGRSNGRAGGNKVERTEEYWDMFRKAQDILFKECMFSKDELEQAETNAQYTMNYRGESKWIKIPTDNSDIINVDSDDPEIQFHKSRLLTSKSFRIKLEEYYNDKVPNMYVKVYKSHRNNDHCIKLSPKRY